MTTDAPHRISHILLSNGRYTRVRGLETEMNWSWWGCFQCGRGIKLDNTMMKTNYAQEYCICGVSEEKRTWYHDQIICSHSPFERPLLVALDAEASHNHNEKPSLACFLQWRKPEIQLFQTHAQINFATCSNRHKKVTKKQKQSTLRQKSSPHGDGGKRVGAGPYLLKNEMGKVKKNVHKSLVLSYKSSRCKNCNSFVKLRRFSSI